MPAGRPAGVQTGRKEGDKMLTLIAITAVMIVPIALTIVEITGVVLTITEKSAFRWIKYADLAAIGLGVLYDILYLYFLESAMFGKDWWITLYNSQMHTPVFTESRMTIWAILLLGVAGYLIVSFSSVRRTPPFRFVLGMSAMYLGTLESIIWTVQIFQMENLMDLYLLLLPICCLCITARTILVKTAEWKEKQKEDQSKRDQETEADHNGNREGYIWKKWNRTLKWCSRILSDSDRWPVTAFFLMWPMLGILIGILLLFGQKPDAVIKAWTETSDWNLSRKIGPQNLYYDEHYLCTVAAGGHKQIVRPLRLGVRHGHSVIVNRQLCIANAFEQILEEYTPRLHRSVRAFYDKYGFPLGKMIHSPFLADGIYILMKPLEWLFLIVLYLVDVNPENRIALQYTGKCLADFPNTAC